MKAYVQSPTTPVAPVGEPKMTTDTNDLRAQMQANLGALNERMGVEFLEVTPEHVVARMPVEGNTQPYGLLHGGASVVLAETVGSVAAALHAGPDRIAVGIDINSTHHRAAVSGYVTATTTKLSAGRTLASFDVAITDDDGRRINSSRITCMLRDAPPGS